MTATLFSSHYLFYVLIYLYLFSFAHYLFTTCGVAHTISGVLLQVHTPNSNLLM